MYFGAKSANQSQNNSKGPCEYSGGNGYKSIYIHSKTSPISTLPEGPLSKEEATAPYKAKLWFATAKKIVLFGEMFSGPSLCLEEKGGRLQAKKHHPTVKHIMLWGALLQEGLVHFTK